MIPELLVLAVVIGLLAKGDLGRLAEAKLRCSGLIVVVLGLWLVPFVMKAIFHNTHQAPVYAIMHVGQFAVLLVLALANHRILGVKLAALGVVVNSVAVIANGGFMPASYEAVSRAIYKFDPATPMVHHGFINAGTRLAFLCDIIPAPRPYVLCPGVYSIGDVITTIGVMIAIIAIMRTPVPSKQTLAMEEQ